MKKISKIFWIILLFCLITTYVFANDEENIIKNEVVNNVANDITNSVENENTTNSLYNETMNKVTINGNIVNKSSENIIDNKNNYTSISNEASSNKSEVVKIDGIWRMVINGKIDYQYTGIGSNELGTWLVENGKVTFKYNGIYKDETGTYVIEGSKVKTDTTEVIKIDGIWRIVINGKIDYTYTGIGNNSLGTWYVENGTVNFRYTGTYFEGNTAFIIEAGMVRAICTSNTTGVIKINETWRMVINGVVDYKYNGIGSNNLGTWYVEKGKVTFKYTGTYFEKETGKTYVIEESMVKTDCTEVMKINGIWRMVINGVINYQYTGIGNNSFGEWYVKDGEVKFDYTGTYFEGNLAYIIEDGKVKAKVNKDVAEVVKINDIWRMVINGEIDYQYTGLGNNSFGTWYVENGKVTFKYNGIYKDETGTYVIEGSKVRTDYTEVVKIDGIWRIVIKGKVYYTYTGIGSNEYGEWYIKDGEVKFDYTGTYFEGNTAYIIEGGQVKAKVNKDIAEVVKINDIWRMVINGEIDYQYTGLGNNSFGTWYVENGKVTFKYNGIYKDETGTYVIEGSKLKTDYTKVMRLDGIWRMVVKGKVDYTYTGIGSNEYGMWYIKDGEVKFDYTGTYFEENKAFIIEDGIVRTICTQNTTEVIKINETWRMVINGVVDYKYNGLGKNEFGTWIIQNGAVNFNYTGKFTDSDGSIYNIVKGEVREVINNSLYPGTMWVDRPINGNNYRQGTLEISGWALSEAEGDIVKIYLDGKFCGNATRQSRPDVFEVYKDEYGGIDLNPLPGYYYKLNTVGLNNGKHIIKIVNLTKDGKTVIQSREVEFKIVNLAKTWGIDVSQFQGNIDWNAVKNNGIDFAILRIGYYLESQGRLVVDQYFERNYNECKRLGIAIGGYFYSYAFNSTEALHEATACLSAINGKTFEMPIFLDMEDNILKNGVSNGQTNKNELTNVGITFCDTMIGAGYRSGVYASKNFFRDYLNVSVLEKYNIWLAHYTSQTDYTGKFDIWQYTSMGSLLGINGNVDFNWCFTRYY